MSLSENVLRVSVAGLVAACLAVPTGTAMRAAAAGFDARYAVQATGIEIGQAALSLESMAEGLRTRFVFESGAMLGLVQPSLTRMDGIARVRAAEVKPRSFEATYSREDRIRDIGIRYGADGEIASFALTKGGRVRVSRVPDGLGSGTVDPLAAILRARAWLGQAVEGDELDLKVFTGRKRYDAHVRYLGSTQITQRGDSKAAHRVALQYRVAQELDEDTGKLVPERGGAQREIEIVVSADGRYLPLRASGSFDGWPLTAELLEECEAPPGCATPH
ncbi:DUF3108 domain-containing protein [Benzoatithermus flavus]|uniref:DUF3108 domain-containing protein n=1 Tax=Benzoatithermus flavus TaxID=3108223 RepID=A0ABU8XP25_9PROT